MGLWIGSTTQRGVLRWGWWVQLIYEDEEEVSDPYQTQDYNIPTNLRTSLVSKVKLKSVSKCVFVESE